MTSLVFDEEWLRDYEKRTGIRVKDSGSAPQPETKRSKYGNRRTTVGDRTFDSQHEAEVWKQLDLRMRAGELAAVVCQQPFLLPGGVKYVADFVALKPDGTYDVIDAKSGPTARDKVYRIKKRLMLDTYGIEILEV